MSRTSGRGLAGCRKLRVLRLDHNLLESIGTEALGTCGTTLTVLDLGYNRLRAIEGLAALRNLEDLNLENNCLEDIQTLTHCTKVSRQLRFIP